MREILFRGKSLDFCDWLCGYIRQYQNGKITICDFETKRLWFVDPSTVGQFTGLADKNGKKIFEGDIVKHYCEHNTDGIISVGTVFWDEKHCMFLRTCTDGNETPQIWSSCEYEVIGNIHDNPELLEG